MVTEVMVCVLVCVSVCVTVTVVWVEVTVEVSVVVDVVTQQGAAQAIAHPSMSNTPEHVSPALAKVAHVASCRHTLCHAAPGHRAGRSTSAADTEATRAQTKRARAILTAGSAGNLMASDRAAAY